MPDLRDDLASLVADAAATVEALRLQGVVYLPRGGALPSPPGEPLAELTTRVRVAPPPPPAPPPLAPRTEAPPRPEPAPAPAPDGPRPLLGAWAALAEGPAERLQKVQARLGARCEACGLAPLTGAGALRSNVVLIADALSAAQRTVLTNMLVKVVNVEPDDVWTSTPRTCAACAQGLAEQVQAIRPRVVLALGAEAAALVGQPERGAWGLWAGAATLATWHPAEIEAEPARKRPAFEALQAVARRR